MNLGRHGLGVMFACRAWAFVLTAWMLGSMAGEPAAGSLEGYHVRWLGTEQGLPGGGATTMIQAKDGYLWFGTYSGIARFDGVGFKVFTPSNTPELPDEGIANAHCDRSGRLWFSTYRGMVSYFGGRWTRHGPETGWNVDYARTFSDGPDGTVYVTGFDGKVGRWKDGRFEEMPPVPKYGNGGFGHCDPQGRFWVAKDAFIGFWNGSAWQRVEVDLGHDPPRTAEEDNGEGIGMGPARDGGIWIVMRRRLVKVGASGVVLRVVLDQRVHDFWKLYEDRQGNLWIGSTKTGVFHVRIHREEGVGGRASGRVMVVNRAGGQEFQAVPFVSEDDEGNLWMGTASEGVACWQPKSWGMAGEEEGLPDSNFRSATVDWMGRLWVASFVGGVFRCDEPGARLRRFEAVDRRWTADAETVLADRLGRVWATRASADGLVLRLEDGVVRDALARDVPMGSMWGLHEDREGVVWVAGEGPLLSFKDGRWHQHKPMRIVGFADDAEEGGLWVASGQSLFRKQGDQFVEERRPAGWPASDAACLCRARGGGLWVGTEENGLEWRGCDGSWGRIGKAEGLPMERVGMVYSGEDGLLWIGGDSGIAFVSEMDAIEVAMGRSRRIHARLLGGEDGLPRNLHFMNVRTPSVARTRDGRLWFPTSRGMLHVDPTALRKEARPPRVHPTWVRHTDAKGRIVEGTWTFGGERVFPAGTRSVGMGFDALEYSAPKGVTTSVRLFRDGRLLSERTGPDRHASWDLLPPGRYAVAVSAANEVGVTSDVGEPFRFTLRPHAWQTTWFRASLLLGIVGGVGALAAYRVRHVRMASELAMAMENVRNADALRVSEARRQRAEAEAEWRRQREAVVRDIHDGVGGLVSNLRSTLGVVVATPEPERRARLLNTMSSLLGETVVELRGLMDAMEARVTDLGSVADELRRYGRLVLAPHGIDLEVVVGEDAGWPEGASSLFVAVFRIFKEAMANAVKHSRATRIDVALGTSASGLQMVIHDNGVGMASEGGAGRGHGSMRLRAAELGGTLVMEHANGLRITVAVPWPAPAASSPRMSQEHPSNP